MRWGGAEAVGDGDDWAAGAAGPAAPLGAPVERQPASTSATAGSTKINRRRIRTSVSGSLSHAYSPADRRFAPPVPPQPRQISGFLLTNSGHTGLVRAQMRPAERLS